MTNNMVNEYAPDSVSHPGESLLDILEERSMSQAELAERAGRPKKTINEIVNGKASITPETAVQLENVFGIPAGFWNERQRLYDVYLARLQEKTFLENATGWLQHFPIKEMIKYNYLSATKDTSTQVKELLQFFGIGSPEIFETKFLSAAFNANYRKSTQFVSDDFALLAWLQYGKNKARDLKCSIYDRALFKKSLYRIRCLSTEEPEVFTKALIDICAACGVAVVFAPELPKIRAYGAVHWDGHRPIIQLCLRGKKDDILWFTFFHEAGHVILHRDKKAIFMDVDKKEGEQEEQASKFAAELLIPRKELEAFHRTNPKKTYDNIKEFAHYLGIAPSIVVGQLQFNKMVPYTHFNKLRKTLRWSCE